MSNVVSAPLTIVSRKTGRLLKTAFVQVRASYHTQLTLTAACEEGIFEATLGEDDIQRARAKHVDASTWRAMLLGLLGFGDSGIDNLGLQAKLTTDDSYDEHGELVEPDTELEIPLFEISVNTKDVLSLLYGTFALPLKDVELVPYAERAGYNLLTWIHNLVLENEKLRKENRENEKMLQQQITVSEAYKTETEQMTQDYRAILQDLEDRFFQVLNAKRQKIAELEPHSAGNLERLNLEYVKRNSTNLNRVHVEDIVAGDKFLVPNKRSPRKRKRKEPQVKIEVEALDARRKRQEQRKMQRELPELTERPELKVENEPATEPIELEGVSNSTEGSKSKVPEMQENEDEGTVEGSPDARDPRSDAQDSSASTHYSDLEEESDVQMSKTFESDTTVINMDLKNPSEDSGNETEYSD